MFILTVGMVVATTSVAIAVVILGLRSPKLSTYDPPPQGRGPARVAAPAPDRAARPGGDHPA